MVSLQGRKNMTDSYKPKTNEEINDLAKKLYRNEIFTSLQISETNGGILQNIFMPLLFMEQDYIQWMIDNDIDMFYAHTSEAMPNLINGYPCFMSVDMLNYDDKIRFIERYNQILEVIDDVPKEETS